MIRIYSGLSEFSFIWNNYKSFLSVEIDYILMATYNSIFIEILMHKFYTLFDWTFQERQKLNIILINII